MRATAIALVLMLAASSSSAWAGSETSHVIVPESWREIPTAKDMQALYPAAALKERVEGSTKITCRVRATGALDACRIVGETPDGYGFGQAGLLMASKFRMNPTTVDGVPVDDGVVTIPINFHVPPRSWGQKLGILR